mmetsp:Transcript_101/g.248  ORF Transcript_101/g.248 Transcript_101/m.248 type:complete len:487 (-) Transcript_101:82-1542(-)
MSRFRQGGGSLGHFVLVHRARAMPLLAHLDGLRVVGRLVTALVLAAVDAHLDVLARLLVVVHHLADRVHGRVVLRLELKQQRDALGVVDVVELEVELVGGREEELALRGVQLGAVGAQHRRDGEIVRALPREAAARQHDAREDAVHNVGRVRDHRDDRHDERVVPVDAQRQQLAAAHLGVLPPLLGQARRDGVRDARPAEGVQADHEHHARERAHRHEVEQRVRHRDGEKHADRCDDARDAARAARDHVHLGQPDRGVAAHAAHEAGDDVRAAERGHHAVRPVRRLHHLGDHLRREERLDRADGAQQHAEQEDAHRRVLRLQLGQVVLRVNHEGRGEGVLGRELRDIADRVRAMAERPHERELEDGADDEREQTRRHEVGKAARHLRRELHGEPRDEGDQHHPAQLIARSPLRVVLVAEGVHLREDDEQPEPVKEADEHALGDQLREAVELGVPDEEHEAAGDDDGGENDLHTLAVHPHAIRRADE